MAELRSAEIDEQPFQSPFENGGIFARSVLPGPGFKETENSKLPKLIGSLAVFNEWAEIRSSQEGHFMERLSRGAFTKTLRESRMNIPVMFQHGQDPQIGPKVLGVIDRLEETSRSVDYEVSLFDTEYNRELLPMLQAGQRAAVGSSFTFRPAKGKQDVDPFPARSPYNPNGIPEVTHHEVKLLEFGPVILPSYAGAWTGTRSMSDEFLFGRFAADPERLRELLTTVPNPPTIPAEALSTDRAEVTHSSGESRSVPLVPVRKRFETRESYLTWLASRT